MTQAQTYQNNQDFYRSGDLRYQFDLSENKDYCYLHISYVPTAQGPTNMQEITRVQMTDFRPTKYTRAQTGWTSNPYDGEVYVYYNGKTDQLAFAGYASIVMNKIGPAMQAANLGTTEARSAFFQQMKREDVPTEVSPLADILVDNSQLRFNFLTQIVLWLGLFLGVVLSLWIAYNVFKRFVG